MASVQDAQDPTTLNQTNDEVTTKTEETKTIPEQSANIDVPTEKPKEETTIDAPAAPQAELPVIVETKEVVIELEKTEDKPKEIIIQDPTAKEITEPASPVEDGESKTGEEATKEATTVEKAEA